MKKKKLVMRLIFIVALSVFIYSGANLGYTYYKYYKVNKDNKDLVSKVVKEAKTPKKSKKKLTVAYNANALKRKIDFKTLKSINKDIIGWVYIPNTAIDYAILKGSSNDQYLHHNYYNKYSFAGSIFIDHINKRDFTDDNTILYGHNMRNGSMFAGLKQFTTQSYMDKHPYVYIYLPNGNINVYSIFSTNIYPATSKMYSKGNNYQTYVKKILSTSLAKRDVDQKNQAPLVMLSTCSAANSVRRNVVYGRLNETLK